jgi:hypothetical protein
MREVIKVVHNVGGEFQSCTSEPFRISKAHGIVVKFLCACNGLCETGAEAGFSSYRDVC